MPTKFCADCNGKGCATCKGNGRIALDIDRLADMVMDAARYRCSHYQLVRVCIDVQIDPLEATVDMLVALAESIPVERRGDFRGVDAVPEEPWRSVMKRIAAHALREIGGEDPAAQVAAVDRYLQRDSVAKEK